MSNRVVGAEVAALPRHGDPGSADALRRGVRRRHPFGESSLADQTAGLAIASAGGGRPVRTCAQRATELAQDADLRTTAPRQPVTRQLVRRSNPPVVKSPVVKSDHRLPPPGTVITRPYKGASSGSIGLARWLQLRGNPLCHAERGRQNHHRRPLQRLPVLPADRERRCPVKSSTIPPQVKKICCAVYTRKSTDEGLDKEFNTLDAQRESAEAYVRSQAGEGWVCLVRSV